MLPAFIKAVRFTRAVEEYTREDAYDPISLYRADIEKLWQIAFESFDPAPEGTAESRERRGDVSIQVTRSRSRGAKIARSGLGELLDSVDSPDGELVGFSVSITATYRLPEVDAWASGEIRHLSIHAGQFSGVGLRATGDRGWVDRVHARMQFLSQLKDGTLKGSVFSVRSRPPQAPATVTLSLSERIKAYIPHIVIALVAGMIVTYVAFRLGWV